MADVERVEYRSPGATRSLTLDVFTPRARSLETCALVLHGGAWRAGSPDAVRDRAVALAERGVTAIAPEYRLLGESPWPAALIDVGAAIDWVHAHASELGIERERVVLQGHSAGAHLALLASAERIGADNDVAALVAFYPTIGLHAAPSPRSDGPGGFDMEQAADGTIASHLLLGADIGEATIGSASPIQQVRSGFPPTLILHGTSDQLIGAHSSVLLYEQMREMGITVDLHLFAGQNHEFDRAPAFRDAVCDEVVFFIERYVSSAARIRAEGLALSPFPAD